MSAVLDAVLKAEDPQRWSDIEAYDSTLTHVSADEKAALTVAFSSSSADACDPVRDLILAAIRAVKSLEGFDGTEAVIECLDAAYLACDDLYAPSVEEISERYAEAQDEDRAMDRYYANKYGE